MGVVDKNHSQIYTEVTETWNPVLTRGFCGFQCKYCAIRARPRGGAPDKPTLYESRFQKHFKPGSYVFVANRTDLWSPWIPDEWKIKVLEKMDSELCRVLLQSKNPKDFLRFMDHPIFHKLGKTVICTTVESDLMDMDEELIKIRSHAPSVKERLEAMVELSKIDGLELHITVEPAMRWSSAKTFADQLLKCNPKQINIGLDSKNQHLPEPTRDEFIELIKILKLHTKVKIKPNSARLIGSEMVEKLNTL